MKKLFTLIVVLSIAVGGFAQTKSMSRKSVKMVPEQQQSFTGLEDLQGGVPSQPRSIMENPEETTLNQTYYDWQTNHGPRNFTAVWPDGYAVMCMTQSLDEAGNPDRGTGLAVYDPATNEWTYTDGRVEGERTGFGSIARYKENGLIVAAHNATTVMFIVNEDFRNGGEWSEPINIPVENGEKPAWPVVQCSGENLDIIHLLYTNDDKVSVPYSPLLYSRYEDGEFTVTNQVLPLLDETYCKAWFSNDAYFMPYDPQKPNRVAFIACSTWSDGKCVISEDNGETWSERVFYKHPNLDGGIESWFFNPHYISAAFDNDDNLHLVYEYNGSTGDPSASSTYYPAVGGVAYWSEILPKNELCLGGIGNVGEPFIMDSTYIIQDLYMSEWYWSDALHEPLAEYIGELEIVDGDGNVLPRDAAGGFLPGTEGWGNHGKYNCGKAGFATMVYDKDADAIYAIWSMIAGSDEEGGLYHDGTNYYFRMFCNVSFDGGTTWEGTKQILTDFMNLFDEMVYVTAIPYIYSDENGKYIYVCYQNDQEPGTFVMQDEAVFDNNFYHAVKIYVDFMGLEENAGVENVKMDVFPNPVTGNKITVHVSSASEVSIYNAVGQLINKVDVKKDYTTINVSDYATGVYFIKANNGSSVTTQKVIIK